jgi:threonine dehydrogenase-like Zn-dependent dehydrogenase
MEIVEAPVPELSAGEVLIRVERVGICGSELSGYLGQNSLRKPPLVMGHEFAGNVAAAATNVSGVAAGDFVVVNPLLTCGDCVYCRAERDNLCVARTLVGAHRAGAFAEFVTVPAAACTVLTSEATRRWAFLIEPLACAVRAVAHAREVGAKSLLVQGAG